MIAFESDQITLDIPRDPIEIDGWKLYTIGHPMVSEKFTLSTYNINLVINNHTIR